jgi:hypothetical protein
MVRTKSDPDGAFEINPQKFFFSQKINQDCVAYNVFGLQNDFHEDRLNFPVCGEKINLGHFRPCSFWSKLGIKS